MAVGGYDRGSSDRGVTQAIFREFDTPSHPIQVGRTDNVVVNDFRTLGTDGEDYAFDNATAGTIGLDVSVEDGVVLLDSASTTATQGAQVQFYDGVVVPAAGKAFAFEAYLKAADIATGPEFFAGLCLVDTTIVASSAVSATDYVGFYSVTDDNVLLFATEDGGTQVLGATSPHTLVDDTYVKLGFRVNADHSVDVYVNGSKTDVALASAADIPVGTALLPSFVCQTGGTTDPIVHVDWYAVAYEE